MYAHGRRRFLQASLALGGFGFITGCGIVPIEDRAPRVRRIGVLTATALGGNFQEFLRGLRELGYTEGHNLVIEYRRTEGRPDLLPEAAAELVSLPVELIFAVGNVAAEVAKQTSSTIPIVVPAMGDPVGTGLVQSLGRPGGNVTGLSTVSPELSGKRVDLLKQALPHLSRLAVLRDPDYPSTVLALQETLAAARALGLEPHSVEVRSRDEFDAAFAAAVEVRADALVVLGAPFFDTQPQQSLIVELAARSRLPAMYIRRDFVELGGLMGYGTDFVELNRRAATYVDKILKGAKPADLAVEQPTKFDFAINLRTAQALGLTMPGSVLQQATERVQ